MCTFIHIICGALNGDLEIEKHAYVRDSNSRNCGAGAVFVADLYIYIYIYHRACINGSAERE